MGYCVSVSLLGFCMGCGMGWTSPMQPLLTSNHPPIGTEPLTLDTVAWLGSIIYIGSLFGSFFWGVAADQLGRKVTSCLVAVPFIISWTLILVANNTQWLLIARFISGISYSGTMVITVVFISEISQDDLRGFFGFFIVVLISIGFLYAYVIGTYLKYYGLAICCLIIPVIFLMTFSWLPETPMFLWKSGQIVKAQQSLLWYRGGDTVETEKTLLKYKSMTSTSTKVSLKSLVATRGTIKAMVIGIALTIAMQSSGAITVLSFAVYIFDLCGTSLTSYQSAIVVAFTQLVSSLFCSVLVDRLGRKLLLVGSLLIMSLSLAILGGYLFYFNNKSVNSVLDGIPLVCLSLHVIAFSGGLGPVANILKGEIFPLNVRGLAISQLQLLNAIFSFTLVQIFPTIKRLLNIYGVFWFFSCCCLFFSIFFVFYLPETKGKSLNIILKILNNQDARIVERSLEEGDQLHERQQPVC